MTTQASILFDIYINGQNTKQIAIDTARKSALIIHNDSKDHDFDRYKKTIFVMTDNSVLTLDSDGDVSAYDNENSI